MSKLDKKQISHIAKLANLPLTQDEETGFTSPIEQILNYFDDLKKVNTENIPPTYSPNKALNVFQNEDKAQSIFTPEEALKNAHIAKNDLFIKNNE